MELLEIGIRIEEDFEIEIADEDYESFVTVGDVYEFVIQRLTEKSSLQLTELTKKLVWKLVVKIVSKQVSMAENEIHARSRFKEDLSC